MRWPVSDIPYSAPSDRHLLWVAGTKNIIFHINFFFIFVSTSHFPGVFLRVIIHDAPEDHELRDSTFEQRDLVFLTHAEEGRNFLRHPDDPLDGQIGQVDYGDQVVGLGGKGLERECYNHLSHPPSSDSLQHYK